jgi:hypothetical protein
VHVGHGSKGSGFLQELSLGEKWNKKQEAVSKVIDPVILNLFQDPNALQIRSRNTCQPAGWNSG